MKTIICAAALAVSFTAHAQLYGVSITGAEAPLSLIVYNQPVSYNAAVQYNASVVYNAPVTYATYVAGTGYATSCGYSECAREVYVPNVSVTVIGSAWRSSCSGNVGSFGCAQVARRGYYFGRRR